MADRSRSEQPDSTLSRTRSSASPAGGPGFENPVHMSVKCRAFRVTNLMSPTTPTTVTVRNSRNSPLPDRIPGRPELTRGCIADNDDISRGDISAASRIDPAIAGLDGLKIMPGNPDVRRHRNGAAAAILLTPQSSAHAVPNRLQGMSVPTPADLTPGICSAFAATRRNTDRICSAFVYADAGRFAVTATVCSALNPGSVAIIARGYAHQSTSYKQNNRERELHRYQRCQRSVSRRVRRLRLYLHLSSRALDRHARLAALGLIRTRWQ